MAAVFSPCLHFSCVLLIDLTLVDDTLELEIDVRHY
jgi:hypothetical protein